MLSLTNARRISKLFDMVGLRPTLGNARVRPPVGRPRVLIVGIYVGSKPNHVDHLVSELAQAKHVEVEQRWICMKGEPPSERAAAVTIERLAEYEPKWMTLERALGSDYKTFDYVLFFDDDITIGKGFLDRFIAVQQACGFALAQPARTWSSLSDWPITRRRLMHLARETRFVEIGPVTSMRRDFLELAVPFDPQSPMGWGYDLAWPEVAREHGLRLGIVDAVRVDHTLRPRSALYQEGPEFARMDAFLARNAHVTRADTQKVLRRYWSLPRSD